MNCQSVIAVSLLLLPALAAADAAPSAATELRVASLPLLRVVDDRYQSFQIGMSHLTGGETWRTYDANDKGKAASSYDAAREARAPAALDSPRLRTLAAALAPFYVRYGGTTSNSVYFQDDDEPALATAPDGFSVVLTRAGWKRGIDFAKAVDARIVTGFAVSDGVRDASGAWTPRMAAPWLAYTRAAGGAIAAAELYNEPNAPEPGRKVKAQAPAQFARDYASFRAFAGAAAPDMKLAGPGVVALGVTVPSLGGVPETEYLSSEPRPKFDIFSYHFYGALAERCAPPGSPMGLDADQALSEEWLARPERELEKQKALRDRFAPGVPIWITETGAAACGGPRWQPSFLDTFRYLDTLARLARGGVDVLITHALISGSNGVLDEKSFLPNADYWAALLWRRLMGNRVLDAGPIRPGLHVYAHCMRGVAGGVSALAINLEKSPAQIHVAHKAEIYTLSAADLQSRTVLLNGEALRLGDDDRLPAMRPAVLPHGVASIAPTSIAFIAVPDAHNASCAAE